MLDMHRKDLVVYTVVGILPQRTDATPPGIDSSADRYSVIRDSFFFIEI